MPIFGGAARRCRSRIVLAAAIGRSASTRVRPVKTPDDGVRTDALPIAFLPIALAQYAAMASLQDTISFPLDQRRWLQRDSVRSPCRLRLERSPANRFSDHETKSTRLTG